MKKVLSLVLALIMILSIGTVGVSAYEPVDYIWIYTSRLGAKVGNYLYFPVYYDDDGYIYGEEDSKIKITFPFFYDPEILKPVEVTPSELLYGMNFESEISKVDVYKYIDEYGVEITYPYFYANITFDGDTKINKGEVLFNVKMEIIGETTSNSGGPIFDSFFLIEDLEQEKMTCCKWEVIDGTGKVVKDLSSRIQQNYRLDIDDTDDNLTLNSYVPFIPPVEDDVPPSKFDDISVDADVFHARIGAYAYFPLAYDCDTAYKYYVGSDKNSKTKIVFPFLYMPDLLEPVEAIPSELLYNMGGTVKITEFGSYVQSNGSAIDYFLVEVNFDGYEGIVDDTILFNIKCKVLSEEFFDEYETYKIGIFDNFHMVEKGSINFSKSCNWEITMSDGTNKDISSNMQPPMLLFYDEYDSYEDFVLKDYEPFIPPVEDDDIENGIYDEITISADVYHARKGDYAYFPVYYDCKTAYSVIADNDSGSGTKIILPFYYNSNLLKPVEAIPSEQLYNIGGTAEIIKTDEFVYRTSVFPYIYVEINFDGCIDIENDVFFNVKFEVISDDFFDEYGRLNNDGLFDEFYIVDGNDISKFKFASWQIEKSNGSVKDLSAYVEPGSMSEFYGTTYEELLLKDYEPFIPNIESDVTEVTYIQQEDTHKTFTVTANGRKQMIQFIEPDGGTRTYDRYNKNVKITSYNADGEIVSSMARDLAYEVWEIYSNMSVGVEIQVRGKENYKWDEAKYSFVIEPYNPIISMELSATSGKKGAVPATVIADEKTEKVMFKMPNGTSVTVSTFTTDESGNHVFTGKAWMNEDGTNEIQVLIRRDNVWKTVGTLEYTVE